MSDTPVNQVIKADFLFLLPLLLPQILSWLPDIQNKNLKNSFKNSGLSRNLEELSDCLWPEKMFIQVVHVIV